MLKIIAQTRLPTPSPDRQTLVMAEPPPIWWSGVVVVRGGLCLIPAVAAISGGGFTSATLIVPWYRPAADLACFYIGLKPCGGTFVVRSLPTKGLSIPNEFYSRQTRHAQPNVCTKAKCVGTPFAASPPIVAPLICWEPTHGKISQSRP